MNHIAFITGSTRGIGCEIARTFAKNNYTVILHGTKETDYAKTAIKEIKKISPKSSICYFDVTNKNQVEQECGKIVSRYPKIRVLINNAGILQDRTFLKMSYDEWDIVIKTNLYGPYLVTKQILPAMIENEYGRVINMSSIIGLTGNFGQTNYSSAKAGLIGFTKSLAKETAKYNITVNAVCPGLVDTDILKDVPDEYMKKMLEKIPLKRLASTEEIAKLILFLSSDNSSYITGETIRISGGWI